jgi:hypothetical protein
MRDHSKENLTPNERYEIELYHSIKQDPFFKHYIHNYHRIVTEDTDDGVLNMP